MNNKEEKIKYFLYARKSSESEDKQVQSIDDQVKRLKGLAGDMGITIVEIFTEAKSAKKPGNRPVFEEMMQRIDDGEADGVLCWKIDRLTRNPVDSGSIQWALQQGALKSIRTMDREYLPDDNALLLSVESGVANQFIIDLRKNTMRGVQSKLEKGWLPNVAPLGYLNDTETKTITVDHERFDVMRKMWDLMLTGNYTAPRVHKIATKEWGLTTRSMKRRGGSLVSLSGVYRIFTNPFYAGIIERAGRRYDGKHKPIITLEEFDQVQVILGRKGKPRPKKHVFAFTGFIRCEECDCLYTAQRKKKVIKETGEEREYTYYHCTRKKKNIKCLQTKYIREEDLELQIENELEKYTILPEFRKWALDILNEQNDGEIKSRKKIYEMQHKALVKSQNELDELTKMRYRKLIDDEEFNRQRDELVGMISDLKSKLRETESRAEKWLELTERTFNFATYARKAFVTGNLDTKKEIVRALGQNFTVRDGILTIQANDWFKPIEKAYPEIEEEYLRLEPKKTPMDKEQTEALASVRSRWGD